MNTSWRAHSGFVAWPTLLLTAMLLVITVGVWGLVLQGVLALWAGTIVQSLVVYASFTPMHEAAHGNVGGSASRSHLDLIVGWACSSLFLAPFPAFKAIHLQHHGTVNQGVEDPDMWVAGSNAFTVALRCATVIPHYYVHFLGRLGHRSPVLRRARTQTVIGLSVAIAIMLTATFYGYGPEVLGLALLPAWFASAALAFAFDYLPHRPHTATTRFENASILLGPGLSLLMLNQNLHLVHHLWPKVPWYRYPAVFSDVRPELEAKNCSIVEYTLTR